MKWAEKNLGELCEFVRGPFGGSLKKEIFVKQGFAVYEQQHAIYDQFDSVRYFIDAAKFNELKRFELRCGDLIMSCSGTFGKVAVAPLSLKRGVINQALLKITPSKDIDVNYLKHFMESKSFQSMLMNETHGAAIKNVASVSVLKKIKIPFPPLLEQQRIATLLDTADLIYNLRESAIIKLDQLAYSVFVDLFGDPKITTKWDRKEISKVAKVYTGKTPSTTDQSNFDGDVPFVTPTDLRGVIKNSARKISHKGAETITAVRSGSSLVGCIGDVGRVGYVTTAVTFNQQINAVDWNNEFVLDVYGFYVLQYMASVFKNKSVSAVVPILNKTNFSSVDIPVPSLNEQIKFVNFINSLWLLKDTMISERESELVSSIQNQSFAVN
jgi:hypothetical protein